MLLPAAAQCQTPTSYSFQTIDFPGAQTTVLNGINNRGQIVGSFYLPNGHTHGLALQQGIFKAFSYPGAVTSALTRINDNGTVIGFYFSGTSDVYFMLTSGNTLTTLAYPGALFTYANDLNNHGQVVGTGLVGGSTVNYLFSAGVYSKLNLIPAAFVQAINNVGDLIFVGATTSSEYHAGNITAIAFPGATETIASDINDLGQIAGHYRTAACGGSFLYAGGEYRTIDVPSSKPCSTLAYGINNAGVIVGYFNDQNGGGHGFIATPDAAAAAR